MPSERVLPRCCTQASAIPCALRVAGISARYMKGRWNREAQRRSTHQRHKTDHTAEVQDVRGSKSSTPRRAVAFAAVLALHAVGLLLLIEFRSKSPPAAAHDFISTLILLSAEPSPRAPAGKQPLQPVNTRIDSAPPHLPVTDSMESPSNAPGRGIDWAAEAQREGTAITQAPKATEFGQLHHGDDEGKALQSTPAHYAGQQYRDEFGEFIVWVSNGCYFVSENAPFDVPRGSIPTRTICVGDSGQPRGDLFKNLPAYTKYHDQ
jgi:hypothetical protein